MFSLKINMGSTLEKLILGVIRENGLRAMPTPAVRLSKAVALPESAPSPFGLDFFGVLATEPPGVEIRFLLFLTDKHLLARPSHTT